MLKFNSYLREIIEAISISSSGSVYTATQGNKPVNKLKILLRVESAKDNGNEFGEPIDKLSSLHEIEIC